MQYLLMIYADESGREDATEADQAEVLRRYGEFTQSIIASGEFQAGEALHPVSTATSVRVRDGQTLLTDGPFAETREQLGGFYLVEAADLDRALAIAAQIPTAEHGTIEVRPLMKWD